MLNLIRNGIKMVHRIEILTRVDSETNSRRPKFEFLIQDRSDGVIFDAAESTDNIENEKFAEWDYSV